LASIKWGKQQGKQRFKCKNCGVLFTANNNGVVEANRFVWFKEWVIGRQTIKRISKTSGYSEKTIRRYFEKYLNKTPTLSVRPSEQVNLLIDGTYFNKELCLVLYRDNTIKYTQLYRITNGEWYEEIKEDLENLLKIGVQIESITCDGHRSILKAAKKVCKGIPVQRCIIHIQRMCKIWLTTRPQSLAGTDLRRIVGRLHRIENREDWGYWVVELIKWHKQHELYINEKSFKEDTGRFWYKHKTVRRCFSVIKRALPNMFHYLDNSKIPKSTNGLESFFGHLKSHITIHRGLSQKHRRSYLKWYLYFKNEM